MPRISPDSKVNLARLHYMILLLKLADAAYRSGSMTEYRSRLNEASDTFKSILATSLAGNGNASTTPVTTLELPMPYGTRQANDGAPGTSVPPSLSYSVAEGMLARADRAAATDGASEPTEST